MNNKKNQISQTVYSGGTGSNGYYNISSNSNGFFQEEISLEFDLLPSYNKPSTDFFNLDNLNLSLPDIKIPQSEDFSILGFVEGVYTDLSNSGSSLFEYTSNMSLNDVSDVLKQGQLIASAYNIIPSANDIANFGSKVKYSFVSDVNFKGLPGSKALGSLGWGLSIPIAATSDTPARESLIQIVSVGGGIISSPFITPAGGFAYSVASESFLRHYIDNYVNLNSLRLVA